MDGLLIECRVTLFFVFFSAHSAVHSRSTLVIESLGVCRLRKGIHVYMWVLVDYDNLDRLERERGLEHSMWMLLNQINDHSPIGSSRVVIRLYGGWFLGKELSRVAQQLSVEISQSYPAVIETAVTSEEKIRVNVELARSLLIDPTTDLFHTYRPRGFPGGIKCEEPPFTGCKTPNNCQTEVVHDFLTSRACALDGCGIRAKDILSRPEQKLVDTMLVGDLIFLVKDSQRVAIVSSDDDMWPGIRMALAFGEPIIHVHPRKGQQTPDAYKIRAPSNYLEIARE